MGGDLSSRFSEGKNTDADPFNRFKVSPSNQYYTTLCPCLSGPMLISWGEEESFYGIQLYPSFQSKIYPERPD
jgi:hypothetical protein